MDFLVPLHTGDIILCGQLCTRGVGLGGCRVGHIPDAELQEEKEGQPREYTPASSWATNSVEKGHLSFERTYLSAGPTGNEKVGLVRVEVKRLHWSAVLLGGGQQRSGLALPVVVVVVQHTVK